MHGGAPERERHAKRLARRVRQFVVLADAGVDGEQATWSGNFSVPGRLVKSSSFELSRFVCRFDQLVLFSFPPVFEYLLILSLTLLHFTC